MKKHLWSIVTLAMVGFIACSSAPKETATAASAAPIVAEQSNNVSSDTNASEQSRDETIESDINHSISKADIQAVVKANVLALQACYNHAKTNGNAADGKIILSWIVEPTGNTSNIAIVESTIEDADMQQCIIDTVAGMQFDAREGRAKVVFPFLFMLKEENKAATE